MREKFTCEVMRPKLPLPNDVLGAANVGVLNAFRASARNCTLNRSTMETFLKIERSQLACPGPRISSVRAILPKVPGRRWKMWPGCFGSFGFKANDGNNNFHRVIRQ